MVVCFCYNNFLLFKMYWRNLGRRPQHFLSKTNVCQTHCLLFHVRPHFFLNMSMVKPVQIMWRNIKPFRCFKCILFFTNVLIQTKINFFKDGKASLLSFKMISDIYVDVFFILTWTPKKHLKVLCTKVKQFKHIILNKVYLSTGIFNECSESSFFSKGVLFLLKSPTHQSMERSQK